MTERRPAGERYVYYRVPVGAAEAAGQEILAAQQRLCGQAPELSARLLRRADATEDPCTWMEVYRHPQGLDDLRWAPVQAAMAGLPTARQGPRHEEHFIPHG